jgi:hypothetical protein
LGMLNLAPCRQLRMETARRHSPPLDGSGVPGATTLR